VGQDGVTIVKAWIDAGCPLPSQAAQPKIDLALMGAVSEVPDLSASISAWPTTPQEPPLHRKQIFGQDAVH
jgi:hypothetical protein